ncbi:MAG: recombination protein RecR [Candidatus Komeilibacteria bacterium RIFCSPLOWO2_01_FULL_52_15]|uniref:Recombination protein RecR n=2 Tax=Candidatus Komeiliibacteriota TaxID=1817908 RepID=A0A1G2BPG5_9BACT|nr:MAG: recombination protein RecR [Candidatus Komeilibacteria bacterium RIFCSPHIGHO2_01_FULL_52_14]OGY90998.1 MAG: recombination protein RecR [Candidatus Komeilibacteria bacterium RIFCSPLOWO2_01_FULL_52_15]
MTPLSPRIQKIIEHFDALPGIGPKHAARLALYLLGDTKRAQQLASDLESAAAAARLCVECQTLTDSTRCEICKDTKRNRRSICVVAHVQDIEPIERTGKHAGVYHVLHGLLSPLDGVTPDHLKIKELVTRAAAGADEIILALDAVAEGDATGMYLTKILKETGVSVSKLARGIPMGSNIEYADEVTLSSAFEDRKKLS